MRQYINQETVNQLIQEVGGENASFLFGIFCDELLEFTSSFSIESEVARIKEISHCLKSSAGSFGADKLAMFAVEIEEKAKAEQLDWVKRNITEFINIARKTEVIYRQL